LKSKVSTILAFSIVGFSLSMAKDKTYSPSNENFANPERGFFEQSSGKNQGIKGRELVDGRMYDGISIYRKIFRLDDYRNSALPASFLSQVNDAFKIVRESGCKLIPRFAYNYERDDDAPKNVILGHIAQLKKVLMDNGDVIAFVEVGFIGQWGEWHDSSNLLDNRETKTKLGKDNVAPGAEILDSLLAAIPKDRMVALRYNTDKRQIFKTDLPLTAAEAYNQSNRSRTGNHNDCFLAPNQDNGTYGFGAWGVGLNPAVEKEKTFLNMDNRYVPQGGETCQVSNNSGCSGALAELKRMRWDAINKDFNGDVLRSWSNGGCMEEIKTHLGYRFQLNKATIQDSARPGNSWTMSFNIVNLGWGKVYNPRAVEIVLRQVNGKAKYRFPVNADPRFWLTDSNVTVPVVAGIPKDMPEGEYKVFLNLPDPLNSLRTRREYSIRLANSNVWEDSTGFNYLDASVIIKATARVQPLSGSGFFTPWEAGVGIRDRSTKSSFSKKGLGLVTLFPTEKGLIDIKGRSQSQSIPGSKTIK
jgi:Domain of unknown function (DUF4832)/Domain of unknown function (DUF4874)